jgi:hypothetical protein
MALSNCGDEDDDDDNGENSDTRIDDADGSSECTSMSNVCFGQIKMRFPGNWTLSQRSYS